MCVFVPRERIKKEDREEIIIMISQHNKYNRFYTAQVVIRTYVSTNKNGEKQNCSW